MRGTHETETCALCQEEVEAGSVRAFWSNPSTAVCYECAVTHGGSFDEETETWVTPPRLPGPSGRGPRRDEEP